MWLYLSVLLVLLAIIILLKSKTKPHEESFVEEEERDWYASPIPASDASQFDMDHVMDRYCKLRIGADKDEYVGPWDTTDGRPPGYCAMSACPIETCLVVERSMDNSEYIWTEKRVRKRLRRDDEQGIMECETNHNGTDMLCGESRAPRRCSNAPQSCYAFNPTSRTYIQTDYDYFLGSNGRCVYRPVLNVDGDALIGPDDPTCRTSYPPLRTSNCDSGDRITQVYDATGQPTYDGRVCATCQGPVASCHRFVENPASTSGGTWECVQYSSNFGPAGSPGSGTCALRYIDDGSLFDPTTCFQNDCCEGTSCAPAAVSGVYNINNRADLLGGAVECSQYVQNGANSNIFDRRTAEYYPRYTGGSPPTGIAIVSQMGHTVDVSTRPVDQACSVSCPEGSVASAAGNSVCTMCDPDREYYDNSGMVPICTPMTGCTAADMVFDPAALNSYLETNGFGNFFMDMDNTDIYGNPACSACPPNTYKPASGATSTTALTTTCSNCSTGRQYYDRARGQCRICPPDASLSVDGSGWRVCSNCPVCPSCNGVVRYDSGTRTCSLECDAGYHGGGDYSSGSGAYPTCHANCGPNQKFVGTGCSTCPAGRKNEEMSHSKSTCDVCPINTYKSATMSDCVPCDDHVYTVITGETATLSGETLNSGSTAQDQCFVRCRNSPMKAYWTGTSYNTNACPTATRIEECGTSTDFSENISSNAGNALSTGAVAKRTLPDLYDSMDDTGCYVDTIGGAGSNTWTEIENDYLRVNRTYPGALVMHTIAGDRDYVCPAHTSVSASNCGCDTSGEGENTTVRVPFPTYTHNTVFSNKIDYRCEIQCTDNSGSLDMAYTWLRDASDTTNRTCSKTCKNGAYASTVSAGEVVECTGCPIADADHAVPGISNYYMGNAVDSNINALTVAPGVRTSRTAITDCYIRKTTADASPEDLCGPAPIGETWTIGRADGSSTPNNIPYISEADYNAYDRSNCIVSCTSPGGLVRHIRRAGNPVLSDVINSNSVYAGDGSTVIGHKAIEVTEYQTPKKDFHQFLSGAKTVLSSVDQTHLPFDYACPVDEFDIAGTFEKPDAGAFPMYTSSARLFYDRDSNTTFYAFSNMETTYWCKDGSTLNTHALGWTPVCCDNGSFATWTDASNVSCVEPVNVYRHATSANPSFNGARPKVFEFISSDVHVPPVSKGEVQTRYGTAVITDVDDPVPTAITKTHPYRNSAHVAPDGTITTNVFGIKHDVDRGTMVTQDTGSNWRNVSRVFPSGGEIHICNHSNGHRLVQSGTDLACCEYIDGETGTVFTPDFEMATIGSVRQPVCHRPNCLLADNCVGLEIGSINFSNRDRKYVVSVKEHVLDAYVAPTTFVLQPEIRDNTNTLTTGVLNFSTHNVIVRLRVVSGVWELRYKKLGTTTWLSFAGGGTVRVFQYVESNVITRTGDVGRTSTLEAVTPGVIATGDYVFVVRDISGTRQILTVKKGSAYSYGKIIQFKTLQYNKTQSRMYLDAADATTHMILPMKAKLTSTPCTDITVIGSHYPSRVSGDSNYYLYPEECVVSCAGSGTGTYVDDNTVDCDTRSATITGMLTKNTGVLQESGMAAPNLNSLRVGPNMSVCRTATYTLDDYDSMTTSNDPACSRGSGWTSVITHGSNSYKFKCPMSAAVSSIGKDLYRSNTDDIATIKQAAYDAAANFGDSVCASNCPRSYSMISESNIATDGANHGTMRTVRLSDPTYTMAQSTAGCSTSTLASQTTALGFGVYAANINQANPVNANGEFNLASGGTAREASLFKCDAGKYFRSNAAQIGCCDSATDGLWSDGGSGIVCCPSGERYNTTVGSCLPDGCGDANALIFTSGGTTICYTPMTAAEVLSLVQANFVNNTYPFTLGNASTTQGAGRYLNTTTMRLVNTKPSTPTTYAYLSYTGSLQLYINETTSYTIYLYKTGAGAAIKYLPTILSSGNRYYFADGVQDYRLGVSSGVTFNIAQMSLVQATNVRGSEALFILQATRPSSGIEKCIDKRPNAGAGSRFPYSPVPYELAALDVTLKYTNELDDGGGCTYQCPSQCTNNTSTFGDTAYSGWGGALETQLSAVCGTKRCEECTIDAQGVVAACCSDTPCGQAGCDACAAGTTLTCAL